MTSRTPQEWITKMVVIAVHSLWGTEDDLSLREHQTTAYSQLGNVLMFLGVLIRLRHNDVT